MITLNDGVNLKIKGEIWMKLGEDFTNQQIKDNPDRHFSNIITDVCSNLLAQLAFCGMSEHVPGVLTLAVGTGGSGWDVLNPPAETSDLTVLYSELYRKQFYSKTYVDISGNPSATPTNKLEFTTVFDYAEANGPLVEMGLFGGDGALLSGGGIRVNAKHFPVLNKSLTSKLSILWGLTF